MIASRTYSSMCDARLRKVGSELGALQEPPGAGHVGFVLDVGKHREPRVRLRIRQLNRQQRTVSGTFAGMLYGRTDSLAVVDGRFDVRY